MISKTNSLDLGGKLALEFDVFSIGVESLYRYNNVQSVQNRTVGLIKYKLTDNLYINGGVGQDFDLPNR
jgi:hypothetical protein